MEKINKPLKQRERKSLQNGNGSVHQTDIIIALDRKSGVSKFLKQLEMEVHFYCQNISTFFSAADTVFQQISKHMDFEYQNQPL